MQILSSFWLWFFLFILSCFSILIYKKQQENKLNSQFIVTGTLLLIFYIVCFISGICTILNFLFNWVI